MPGVARRQLYKKAEPHRGQSLFSTVLVRDNGGGTMRKLGPSRRQAIETGTVQRRALPSSQGPVSDFPPVLAELAIRATSSFQGYFSCDAGFEFSVFRSKPLLQLNYYVPKFAQLYFLSNVSRLEAPLNDHPRQSPQRIIVD